ncbi:transglycosylase domain-containing protein [Blastococcus sp. TF02A-30]|uniref:transglycosylase domain-containing protein n=1 Tax=Blastococcus sp. TF02A-30 TaxID=2250580 RepID=UPI000DE92F27|nr:transglycosylase domain-containing protein [Blastococcus sp. TF02A-30]RBY84613.1 penicillin-binding protein [Blastococcus sp. TF02A-30]
MPENTLSKGRIVGRLALAIVIAGLLLAGLLMPVVGGGGLVARNSANMIDSLPDELTDATPAGMTRVLAADGSLITNFYEKNRTPVAPDQISEVMKQALVDIEDSRFYEHNGLDVEGTMRALVKNLAAGEVREGGSTLTQQLVKQTLIQTATSAEDRAAAQEQTPARKLREARMAMALEEKYEKDEILTRYLNLVYFGNGAYGIQAAAQKYFSVNAIDLTLPQAAMLAGLVQSPTNDDPINNPENAQVRRNQVLQRMLDLGHITQQEFDEITPTPVAVAPGVNPPNGCIDASLGGFFCAFVYDHLIGTLGLTDADVKNGGLTVQTTLRPDLQRSADQSVLNQAPMGDPLVAAFDAVEPGTGHVLAMSLNRRYGCDAPDCESVNLAVRPSKGAGSTYKVFTAAAALKEGFGAGYTINAPQPYTSRVFKGYRDERYGPLVVSNDNAGYAATYNMTSGLVASSNTYFVALEDALGSVDPVVDTAVAMGMNFEDPVTQQGAEWWKEHENGTFTLGPEATSPLDLATAYATVAASGTQCDPVPVTGVLDRNGEPFVGSDGNVLDTGNRCTPEAIPAGVANTLANMMVGVVENGTGTRARVPGHTIAGKTGTTQDNATAAFGGITPNYAVSVMYFDPLGNVNVGSHGGGTPAQIFHDAMAPILAGQPNTPFAAPDPAVAAGTKGGGYRPTPTAPRRPAPSTPSTPSTPEAPQAPEAPQQPEGGAAPDPNAPAEGAGTPEEPAGD